MSYRRAIMVPTVDGGAALRMLPVAESSGGGGIADAPSDNNSYARRNGDWVEIPRFLTYVKPADEIRISSTAYTPDADLVSEELMTDAVYRFELLTLMSGDTANDLRFRVERVGLADAELQYASDLDNSAASTLTWNSNVNNNLAGTSLRMGNYIGLIRTGKNPGSVRLAWGQQVSGIPAIETTLKAGSMMMLRRIV